MDAIDRSAAAITISFNYLQSARYSMIKAVLFDVDGTLLDRDRSLAQFVDVQYDRLIAHLRHIPKTDYIARFVELDSRGHVWKDKVYQSLVEEFELSHITWQALLEDYVTRFQLHCIPFNGLIPMLSNLKQEGYRLGIITNGRTEFQRRSIEGLKIQDYLDIALVSEEEQVRKPDPEIFIQAVSRLSVEADESVFVGDNPDADVVGAKNAGMKAIWKSNSYSKKPDQADAVVEQLAEIPSIVKSMKIDS